MHRRRWAFLPLLLALMACGPIPGPTPAVSSTPFASPTPATGATVLMRLDACPVTCLDPRRVQYWSDGTVIRFDPGEGRFLVRRLGEAGLARVTARIGLDGDLLVRELRADPVLLPGRTAPPYTGLDTYTFYPPSPSGAFLRISTVRAGSLDPALWRSTPEIDRLTALGDALLDPDALAQGGWSDPAWLAYDPPERMVYVIARDSVAPFSSPDVGSRSGPLGQDLVSFGITAPSPLDAWPITRCTRLTRRALDDLLATLPAPAFPGGVPISPLVRVSLGDATRSRELVVMVLVPLPDELARDCSDPALGYVW